MRRGCDASRTARTRRRCCGCTCGSSSTVWPRERRRRRCGGCSRWGWRWSLTQEAFAVAPELNAPVFLLYLAYAFECGVAALRAAEEL